MKYIQNSLFLLGDFFLQHKVQYWLEAGTALAAYRDGKIFPWDHDIDIGIWRSEMPEPQIIIEYFEKKGFDVIIQKNFPFIDNIIQLKVRDGFQDKLIDIDIYLYSHHEGYAYMRWIQKPEGKNSELKKRLIFILRSLVNPKDEKWKKISNFIPLIMAKSLFKLFLKYHIYSTKCIYHRFPDEYFLRLKLIEFYGFKVNIPLETDEFLTHRYGPNWRTPDSQFNQTGKWKQSAARVELNMNLIPSPEFNDSLISRN
jgi:phosphorylcholine metabolism protein LicD